MDPTYKFDPLWRALATVINRLEADPWHIFVERGPAVDGLNAKEINRLAVYCGWPELLVQVTDDNGNRYISVANPDRLEPMTLCVYGTAMLSKRESTGRMLPTVVDWLRAWVKRREAEVESTKQINDVLDSISKQLAELDVRLTNECSSSIKAGADKLAAKKAYDLITTTLDGVTLSVLYAQSLSNWSEVHNTEENRVVHAEVVADKFALIPSARQTLEDVVDYSRGAEPIRFDAQLPGDLPLTQESFAQQPPDLVDNRLLNHRSLLARSRNAKGPSPDAFPMTGP